MKSFNAARVFASIVVSTISILTGCSTPSLSPIADEATSVRDDALIGEWKSDEYWARITAPSDKPQYKVAISALDDDEIKGSMNLEMRATQIGDHRYIDLFMARSERRKLAEQYGGLAIPTHQIMRYTVDGDVLSLWLLPEGELPGTDGRTRITYDDNDSEVLTAETAALRTMIESAPADTFERAAELRRVR